MRVRDFYGQGRAVFSLEIFPPKTEPGLAKLKRWLEEATACGPDFISVTYGAGGGTRQGTHELCAYIKDRFPTECMAHLTCVAHTQAHIAEVLSDLAAAGVENVMALRGDPPQGEGSFSPPPDGFRHAAELVRSIAAQERFCIGVAGYPEGHVEAPGYEADLRRQAEKIAAGADLVVSQFFLDNRLFHRWRDDLRAAGVQVPIVAGILPAQSIDQIARFAGFCGVGVPEPLRAGLTRHRDDAAAAAQFGLDYALSQVEDLLAAGVDGVHLYALNKLEPVRAIAAAIRGHAAPLRAGAIFSGTP